MKLFMTFFIFTLLTQGPSWSFEYRNSSVTNEEKKRSYEVFSIKTKVENHYYTANVFRPTQARIKSILIISPNIDGVTSMEETNALFFSKRGYLVIVPDPFLTELSNPRPDIERLNADFYRPAVSTISFINFVEQKLNLGITLPIFAMGASQGGISSIILAANIPRIKAIWTAVAGGDLPHIYAHSEVKQLKKFRINHMRILGISNPHAYEDYLRIYLTNDPLVSCKNILIPFHQTIALKDLSVPTKTQELLARECPPHSVSRKKLGHLGGALTTVRDRQDILEFFDSNI